MITTEGRVSELSERRANNDDEGGKYTDASQASVRAFQPLPLLLESEEHR